MKIQITLNTKNEALSALDREELRYKILQALATAGVYPAHGDSGLPKAVLIDWNGTTAGHLTITK